MTQESVTLPREVVEQVLHALWNTAHGEPCFSKHVRDSMASLRAALERPQDHVPDAVSMVPDGWKLVPVEPTQEMLDAYIHMQGRFSSARSDWAAMLAAAPQPPTTEQSSAVQQPQGEQPAMTPIAQRKLEDLMASGYTISGYSVYHERKHQHGFVTGAGLVGWWKPEGVEYPQPHGEPSTVAFCHVGDVVVCDNDSLLRQLGVKRSDKLYLHPQDLNCKSKQALLATLWGYTKEQPKRPPLTHYEIHELFRRSWGDCQDGDEIKAFARAIEAAHDIK